MDSGRGADTAIIWERNAPDADHKYVSFKELHEKVQRLANVLKSHDVQQTLSLTHVVESHLDRPDTG